MSDAAVLARSLLFAILQAALTIVFGVLSIATIVLPLIGRYRFIGLWSRSVVWLAAHVCGVRYRVTGAERIPTEPCIVLCKHQSAWETIALQIVLPPQVWVLKRELLKVPFFGWGLAMLSPIAIDRSAGRQALKQMVEQGRQRLGMGFWIVMFPEGTRVAPGQRGQYHVGGAWLATQTGTTVLPIAHNAGTLWPRNAFLKYPGTITIAIGEPIDPTGMKAEALRKQVEEWIEAEVARLGSARA